MMKKLIFFVLVITCVSCKKEPPFVAINGTLSNFEGETIVLSGINFTDTIDAKEGQFGKMLYLPYDGLYTLKINDKVQKFLYLEKDFMLTIQADMNDFDNTLTFTGINIEENNFMLKKHSVIQEFYGAFGDREGLEKTFGLNEEDFIQLNEDYKTKILSVLKESKITNKKFVELETQDATFHTLKYFDDYPNYHGYFKKIEEFKVSETFPKTPDNFDYENETYYYFSNSYRNLVSGHFYNKLFADAENYDGLLSKAFKMLDAMKSSLIKSELVSGLDFFLNASSETLEEDFNKMISYSMDPIFKVKLTEKFELLKKLTKGNPSPKFSFENIDSSTTSLDDLNGKNVYIDVWATWCGPCIAEIPALKELEKTYHGKNIEFVSISIDDYKDKEKWKKMVENKELKGTQLIADKDWKSDFVKQYAINGIPRFILLDTEGNIVSADAPRPSDPKIREMLNRLEL